MGELLDAELLHGYQKNMSSKRFKERYVGLNPKYTARLSPAAIRNIWREFMEIERHDFFDVHRHMDPYAVARIGIDKFVYMMGWEKPNDVKRWRNNKLRIGICCHCHNQFVLMMLQANHGLCKNCKPLYSSVAIRNFLVKQLWESDRYKDAHRDLFMDFFILFFHHVDLRALFLKDSPSAKEWEADERPLPDWFDEATGRGMLHTAPSQTIDGDELTDFNKADGEENGTKTEESIVGRRNSEI
jgi:hypothetical protein